MRLPGGHLEVSRTVAAMLLLAAAGCERTAPPSSAPSLPAAKRTSPPARTNGPAAPSPVSSLVSGADQGDSANAPAVLPRSYDVVGWVKHEPIRVVPPDESRELIADETLRAAMDSYRLKSLAHCVYRYVTSEVTKSLLLDVLWVEALDSDDAFGLFSALAPPPRGLSADGSQTAERRDPDGVLRLFGWQGGVCTRMTIVSDDERGTLLAAARGLRAKLLFSLPRADPPELLRLMPRDHRLPEHEWLVRSTAAMRLPGTEGLPAVNLEALEKVLGLDGDAWLAIAAYEVAPGESPNYVWVARYPDAQAAVQAVERYRAHLESSDDEVDRNTMVAEPQGCLAAGTWTADQESVQHLLPRLLAALASASSSPATVAK